jgi:hypothetical protein
MRLLDASVRLPGPFILQNFLDRDITRQTESIAYFSYVEQTESTTDRSFRDKSPNRHSKLPEHGRHGTNRDLTHVRIFLGIAHLYLRRSHRLEKLGMNLSDFCPDFENISNERVINGENACAVPAGLGIVIVIFRTQHHEVHF